jgi:nickel-dependent lactate racemase
LKRLVKAHLDNVRAHLDCIEADLSAPAPLPMTAEQFIHRHAGTSLNVRNTVPLFALGSRDYEHRKYMCKQAGRQLGEEIAKKLDFAMSQTHQRDRFIGSATPVEGEYVSTVSAFTPIELTKLIDEALRIGRESA